MNSRVCDILVAHKNSCLCGRVISVESITPPSGEARAVRLSGITEYLFRLLIKSRRAYNGRSCWIVVCAPLDAARRDFALDLECAYELAVDRPSFRISKKFVSNLPISRLIFVKCQSLDRRTRDAVRRAIIM